MKYNMEPMGSQVKLNIFIAIVKQIEHNTKLIFQNNRQSNKIGYCEKIQRNKRKNRDGTVQKKPFKDEEPRAKSMSKY